MCVCERDINSVCMLCMGHIYIPAYILCVSLSLTSSKLPHFLEVSFIYVIPVSSNRDSSQGFFCVH